MKEIPHHSGIFLNRKERTKEQGHKSLQGTAGAEKDRIVVVGQE